MRLRLRRCLMAVLLVVLAAPAARVAAQQSGPPQSNPAQVPVGDTSLLADTIPVEDNSARKAFARALILPGWGHFAIGANRRGLVFVALEGTSWFMLVKTITKLNRAQTRLDGFEGLARDSLTRLIAADTAAARRLADEVVFDEAVAANVTVAAGQSLVNSRKEQRQDWITYTLFFTMASAVDAYVAANLRDFPVSVSAGPTVGGGFNLSLTMPVGRRVR